MTYLTNIKVILNVTHILEETLHVNILITDYIEFSINNMGTLSCIKSCPKITCKCFCRKLLQKYLILVSVWMSNTLQILKKLHMMSLTNSVCFLRDIINKD